MDEDNIIVLNDENGQEVRFEFLDLIEMDGDEYIILLPEDQDDETRGEVVILQVEDVDGNAESYVGVEDEETLEQVFTLFREKYKDEFVFID